VPETRKIYAAKLENLNNNKFFKPGMELVYQLDMVHTPAWVHRLGPGMEFERLLGTGMVDQLVQAQLPGMVLVLVLGSLRVHKLDMDMVLLLALDRQLLQPPGTDMVDQLVLVHKPALGLVPELLPKKHRFEYST
jgi:hypothetical protein